MHDPGRLALRRAARVAVVMPPLFAFFLIALDDLQAAMLASFGAIGLLGFADFGGPLARRARAYVGLGLAGAVLIVLATVVSDQAVPASVTMAVVAFVVTIAGAAGGYLAAGGTAALLVFVLCAVVPADLSDLPSRLAGWGLASLVALVAALVLWPAHERAQLTTSAASLAGALARLLGLLATSGAADGEVAAARADAAERSTELMDTFLRMPFRPAGPTVHDQAATMLASDLRRTRETAEELAVELDGAELPPLDVPLLMGAQGVLLEVEQALQGGPPPAGVARLEEVRRAHRAAAGGVLRADDPQRDVHRMFLARVLSYLAGSAAINGELLRGRPAPAADFEIAPLAPGPGPGSSSARVHEFLGAHLDARSVPFQAAVRAAAALAIAVAVGIVADLEHAFWVALGTMTVLKSSVLSTGVAAWQVLLGTLAGFGLSTVVIELGGSADPILWAVLPVAVFLAIYTPNAIHAVIGQAMFTVTVVVLFNLIEPEGWRTGLVRLEDILIGCATSVLVGLVFWPRGARRQLRRRLSELFDSAGLYAASALQLAVDRVTAPELAGRREHSGEQLRRATDAFATYLNERGPKHLPVDVWARLLSAGYQLRFVGDAVVSYVESLGRLEAPAQAASDLDDGARQLGRRAQGAGRSLVDPHAGVPGPAASPSPAAGAPGAGGLPVLWLHEWLRLGESVLDRAREPLELAHTVGSRPWWR